MKTKLLIILDIAKGIAIVITAIAIVAMVIFMISSCANPQGAVTSKREPAYQSKTPHAKAHYRNIVLPGRE